MAERGLLAIAELLMRYGVEFIVIGGQAEILMGSSRMTFDIDLCYRRTPENLNRLAEALKELKPGLRGAPAGLPVVIDARALALGNNYTFNTRLGPIDLLGWVEPLGDYEALMKNAEIFNTGKFDLKAISLDDLIRVKEHVGRQKDRDSLVQLHAIRKERHKGRGAQPG